ncbi:MAG: ribbon-helix-helix protein, CopG family [Clostridia bacterium]
MKFQQVHLRVEEEIYNKITKIAEQNKESIAEVIRQLVRDGLALKVTEENTDLIAKIVRQQMEIVIKPHIERLAALSSKSGHMSATAAFLNVQALMDLVPKENRKDIRPMYESARKKSAAYMKTRAEDWDNV